MMTFNVIKYDECYRFVVAVIMLCAAQTFSDESAHALNGNTLYCPDGCSIRAGTALLSSIGRKS